MDQRLKDLQIEILKFAKIERDAGAKMFKDKPDRWYDNPKWRCINDHVSRVYIKSEYKGGAICPSCFEFVLLSFPEDKDGPI